MEEEILTSIHELEILADLMQERVDALKNICRNAKEKMKGVATPHNKKDLEKVAAYAVAKRRARMNGK